MKKLKKLSALFLTVLLLLSCMTITAYAAERETQDGLSAVIETDKESYEANEPILVTVTVTNNNSFAMKNVSIESILPASLTLHDGTLKSDTVDLEAGEKLTLTFTAVLEKEVPPVTEPGTSEPDTSEPDTSEPDTTEPTVTDPSEPDTSEPDTSESDTTEPTVSGEVTTTEEPTTITPETPTFNAANQTNGSSPVTGASAVALKVLLVVVMVAAVAFAVVMLTRKNGKKATKIISVVLSAVIGVSALATTGMIAKAEENTRYFSVYKMITVDGEDYTLSANVQYVERIVESEEIEKELENIKKINGGTLPEIIMDEEYNIPSFIYGKYSDSIIKTGQDAISSLNDVKYLFRIDDPETEFECADNYKVLDTISFRLQQYYNGIKVEQGEIIVTTDLEGNITAINGAYIPLDFELGAINISENQAVQIVSQNFEAEANTPGPNELVIYKDYSTQEFQPVYLVYGSGFKNNCYEAGTYYISAITGEVLNYNSVVNNYTVSATGIDNNKNERSFEVEKIDDDLYYLADFSKNIAVYDAGNKQVGVQRVQKSDGTYTFEIWWKDIWNSMDSWFTKAEVVQSKNNTWKDKDAVTLYANLYDTYNYYLNLGRQGFNDDNGEIFAIFNDNFNWDWTNAASYTDEKVEDMTVLTFGKENPINFDTVAHEYTHSVQKSIAWTTYSGETGAIMEAYADIMGEIIQNDSNWINDFRNIKNPFLSNNPAYYYGANWHDTSDSFDNGGVHNNSTVLSHAAYIMYENGISMDELAHIFYKSMRDMTRYANFQKFREAVIKASLEINEKNTDIVKAAFDKAGIFDNSRGTITGTVKDKVTGEPISGVKVYIEEDGVVPYSCYTNENGGFELELPVGHHLIHYSHENYEHAMNGFDIEKDATTMIMEPIYLTPKNTDTPIEPGIPDTAVVLNGHYYQVYDTPMTWDEAKAYCESLGGHLVTITSDTEQEFVETLIANGKKKSYWLGGTDAANEGTWEWITGEKFDYTNWREFMPDNWQNEDYLMMYKEMDPSYTGETFGRWNDLKSDGTCPGNSYFSKDIFGFICEWEDQKTPFELYQPIIDEYYLSCQGNHHKDGLTSCHCSCAFCDIDGDGTEELIIQDGQSENGRRHHIYAIRNGKAVELGSYNAWHLSLYDNVVGDGKLVGVDGMSMSGNIYTITITESSIIQEVTESFSDVDSWPSFPNYISFDDLFPYTSYYQG